MNEHLSPDTDVRASLRAVVPQRIPLDLDGQMTGVARRVRTRHRRRTAGLLATSLAVAGVVGTVAWQSRPQNAAVVASDGQPASAAPSARPSGTVADPLSAPVRPRAEVTAGPPPAPGEGAVEASVPWTLVARSDDGRAFLITVAVPNCTAWRTFQVEERADHVVVGALLRKPGADAVCLGNVPHVNEVSYVVTLAEPLGERPLLHAPLSEGVAH